MANIATNVNIGKKLITLHASRIGTSVKITNNVGVCVALFTNKGYRPTRATKKITLNCWDYNLIWD